MLLILMMLVYSQYARVSIVASVEGLSAGLLGGIKGVGKGLGGTVYYPLKGVALAAEDLGLSAVNAGVLLKTKGGEHYAGAKRGIG